MQFEQQTIMVGGGERKRPVSAMVAVGTGLAYNHMDGDENQPYELTHLASGLAAICNIPTEAAAQRLVELAVPLTDWTQDSQAICALGPSVARQLREKQKQAEEEAEAHLKRFLSPEQLKMIEQITGNYRWLIGDVLDEVLEAYLNAEDDGDEAEASPFLKEVQRELDRACEKHPALYCLHEAYAVILEEVNELKAEVWKQHDARDLQAIRRELAQIAAMCARTVEDGLVD
jgi:hypothetical protein